MKAEALEHKAGHVPRWGRRRGQTEHEGHIASERAFEQKQTKPGEGLTAGWVYDQPGFS